MNQEGIVRVIDNHKVNPINEVICIAVMDEPGQGGANHVYDVSGPDFPAIRIHFQEGPIGEYGPNGLTQEVLIAICIDRLRGFQSGEYACRENALAITKLEEAQHWLFHRTRRRMARGVEGTNLA